MEKITEKFSEFCEEIEFKNLPADVVKRTKLLILDTVGIIIRARHDAESTPSLVSVIIYLCIKKFNVVPSNLNLLLIGVLNDIFFGGNLGSSSIFYLLFKYFLCFRI